MGRASNPDRPKLRMRRRVVDSDGDVLVNGEHEFVLMDRPFSSFHQSVVTVDVLARTGTRIPPNRDMTHPPQQWTVRCRAFTHPEAQFTDPR